MIMKKNRGDPDMLSLEALKLAGGQIIVAPVLCCIVLLRMLGRTHCCGSPQTAADLAGQWSRGSALHQAAVGCRRSSRAAAGCQGSQGHGFRCFLIRSAKSAASSAFEKIARAEVSLPPPFPL